MNWREKIICDWPNDLQKAHRAKTALADLDRTLLELAGLGHPLHIEEGYIPPPPPGWPKAMFHILAGARTVNCQADLDELGEDWYPTMEEARHAAGLTKQYQRGGIFDKALPQMLTQTPQQIQQSIADEIARKESVRKFANDMRLANRESFQANTILVNHEKLGPDHEPTVAEKFEAIRGRLK